MTTETQIKELAELLKERRVRYEGSRREYPNAKQLHRVMKEATGSASPDGWTGPEVKKFLYEAAESFQRITERWAKWKRAPTSLKTARQTNLIKSKVTERNRIEAADIRPISVSRVWWRIYTSAVVSSEEMKKWKSISSWRKSLCHNRKG